MKYSGIDLHSNNSVVVVSDEADRVLVRRRLPNDAATILALLGAHREELVGVVVESTYNWYWRVDALQAARSLRLPSVTRNVTNPPRYRHAALRSALLPPRNSRSQTCHSDPPSIASSTA